MKRLSIEKLQVGVAARKLIDSACEVLEGGVDDEKFGYSAGRGVVSRGVRELKRQLVSNRYRDFLV